MKTDELIALLVSRAGAVEPNAVARRYSTALGWGAFGATLLMAVGFGVRPDVHEAARLPMFWIKLAFPAVLAVGGLLAAVRLSRPGMRLGQVWGALVAPVLAMWSAGAFVLLGAPPSAREALIFDGTWAACPLSIALLSVPAFAAILWAMKGLAPTRPALAGAAAGLLAGAIGALACALHCTEMSPPFLGVWFLAGMLIPAGVGALLGPHLLRW
ncbi:MAG: DUF1109 domain-containing protein [Casimicrobiaceae bacterium]